MRRRRLALAAALLAATACGPFAPGEAPPALTATRPLLAYGDETGGYVSDVHGTAPKVQPTTGTVVHVVWSADGRYAAFGLFEQARLVIHDVRAGTTATWEGTGFGTGEVVPTSRGFTLVSEGALWHVAYDGRAESVRFTGVSGEVRLLAASGDRLFVVDGQPAGDDPRTFYEAALDGRARRLFHDGEGTAKRRTGAVTGFAPTTDGRRYVYATAELATGGNDCGARYVVVVRDAATNRELPIAPPVSGRSYGQFSIERTTDGEPLVVASKGMFHCVGTEPAGAYTLAGERWTEVDEGAWWVGRSADGRLARIDGSFGLSVDGDRIRNVQVAAWQPR